MKLGQIETYISLHQFTSYLIGLVQNELPTTMEKLLEKFFAC